MSIIQKVKQFVEAECKKPSSKQGYEPFTGHFIPVVEYADKLSSELGGDKEVIILSAWLHDIGSIIEGRENHHISGAKIAEIKLQEFGYPQDKINMIKECILSHRGSQKLKPKGLEAQILVEADTMSAFNNITGLFQCAFSFEKLTRKDAQASIKQQLQNKWKQLRFASSKKILRPKYEAAMLLLK